MRLLRRSLSPYAIERDGRDNRLMRSVIASALTPNSSCVDVGANHGHHLDQMVRCAPRGQHIAFEPLPELVGLLESQFPMVDVRQVALSKEAGDASFIRMSGSVGYSGLNPRVQPKGATAQKIAVRVSTLDKEIPQDFVPALIKIDVEGAEADVLEGGLETLGRARPLILVEAQQPEDSTDTTDAGRIYSLLVNELGMRIFDIDGSGPFSAAQFVESYSGGSVWNYLARD